MLRRFTLTILAIIMAAEVRSRADQQRRPELPRITEQQARNAVSVAHGWPLRYSDTFADNCERAMRQHNKNFERLGYMIVGPTLTSSGVSIDPGLSIWVTGPAERHCIMAGERIRRMESFEDLRWDPYIYVQITPTTINASDVDKVVVTRDNVEVKPVENTLKPEPLTTAMNATVMLHAGIVKYPLEAFEPGAIVVVTAMTRLGQGRNFTAKFNDSVLRKLQ